MNVLTFDMEEWIVYNYFDKGGKDYFLPIIDNYLNKILDLLDKYNHKATFFCLGQLAKEYPHVIKQIIGRGHDIGCHSDTHSLVTGMNRDSFYNDTLLAMQRLEDICGQKIISYRAPAFSITEQTVWAFDVLVELGIAYDSSLFPASRSNGGFPAFSIYQPFIIKTKKKSLKEFPVNIIKVMGKKTAYSGGGYFRLVPYSFIRKWTKESSYTMTYFHIRDFDKEQKVVYSLRYFKSYYGIKNAFEKFQQYLADFAFVTLGQTDRLIDWKNVQTINL